MAQVLAVTGTGTLPGLQLLWSVGWGTRAVPIQGHLKCSREQVPIVKGVPGVAAPGSPVSRKGDAGKWDPYLGLPTGIPSALLTCGVCLGAGTAHLCCARLRAATSLKGDVSFPALSVLPPYPKPLCSHSILTEFLLCVETGRIPRPSTAAGLLRVTSLLGNLWGPSLYGLGHGGAAPTAGQHQDGGMGSWRGFSRSCPSICSLTPPP